MFLSNFGSLRESISKVSTKHGTLAQTERAEYLPVEWRSSLKLDGGNSNNI